MNYLTAAELVREPKVEDCKISGAGVVKVKEMSRSEKLSFNAWLRPDGELDSDRDQVKDLRLCVVCLLAESGEPMFQFDDPGFDAWVESLNDKASGIWSEIAFNVLRVNGYLEPEESDILGE
jgi:hypothetical protein